MRKNRYDWTDEVADAILENPMGYTRATRRSFGLRMPAFLVPEGLEAPADSQVPRYARRHILSLMRHRDTRRVRKQQARVLRIAKRIGTLGGSR
jgi:hypothetical protein